MPERLTSLSYAFALLWLFALTFSIAVAEASLWIAAAAWSVAWLLTELDGGDLARNDADTARSPAGDVLGVVGAPVIAFFAISLLSAFRSRDMVAGLLELREVFLFAAPLVVWAQFRNLDRRRTGQYVYAAGIFLAVLWGMYQTVTGTPQDGQAMVRATGPLGHYMTFSGVLLVSIPLLLSIRGGAAAIASKLVAVLAVTMIVLTLTRSAWIGCAVALIVYAATGFVRSADGTKADSQVGRQRAATYVMAALIGVTVIGLLLASLADPVVIQQRAESTFSLEDPTNRDRLAMAATGLLFIKAYPFLGVGPGIISPEVYAAWVVDWGVNDDNQHLHNNLLQIAAERGLLGLAAWLWMMAAFALVAWRVLKARGSSGLGGPEARAALAALAGFLAMGMFEYNFSDSEVLMAFLYVVSLPLAAAVGTSASDA